MKIDLRRGKPGLFRIEAALFAVNAVARTRSRQRVETGLRTASDLDGDAVRSFLLDRFGVEIASSFGPMKGRIWRIGTMGHSASRFSVKVPAGEPGS